MLVFSFTASEHISWYLSISNSADNAARVLRYHGMRSFSPYRSMVVFRGLHSGSEGPIFLAVGQKPWIFVGSDAIGFSQLLSALNRDRVRCHFDIRMQVK